jgi:hypothetical protein
VLLGVLGIVLVPREAAAQVCRASLRFDRDSHLQLGGSAGLLHGSTLKTGSTAQFLGAIGDKDLYARVGIGRNRYSDYGFSTTDFNVAVGTQIQVSERHGIVACPEADLDIETNDSLGGPNVSLSSCTHSGAYRSGSAQSDASARWKRLPALAEDGSGVFTRFLGIAWWADPKTRLRMPAFSKSAQELCSSAERSSRRRSVCQWA